MCAAAVWVDSRELTAGDLLQPEVEAAIEKARHFVVLHSLSERTGFLSPASLSPGESTQVPEAS